MKKPNLVSMTPCERFRQLRKADWALIDFQLLAAIGELQEFTIRELAGLAGYTEHHTRMNVGGFIAQGYVKAHRAGTPVMSYQASDECIDIYESIFGKLIQE